MIKNIKKLKPNIRVVLRRSRAIKESRPTSNSFHCFVEKQNPTDGSPIKYGEIIRLKHISTGGYIDASLKISYLTN